MTIFVERRFELSDTQLIARFGAPTEAVGGEFQCHYTLEWPEHQDRGYACGEDGIQALMLAMKKVHIALVKSDAYRQGQLTLSGAAGSRPAAHLGRRAFVLRGKST